MSNKIKIKFSDKLINILKKLEDNNNYVAFEMLYLIEPNSNYFNGLNISYVDVGKNFTFLVTIDNKQHYMKVGKFIRYYFKDIFTNNEISQFSHDYNSIKNGGGIVNSEGKKISVTKFEYKPSDPRSTFLSMVTKTYPHGHEEEVLEFLPKLEKDQFGNYYTIIGDKQPTIMFTSHLDTADREQKETNLYSREDENGDEIIYTDGSTILGADDKAGVTVMLYMMDKKVPGLYYFFIGEERGGIGSNKVSVEYDSIEYLKNIKKCVSFDRRKTGSVITEQLGRVCCSNEFGTALCNEYNKSGLNFSLDPTGIYTDSASFIDDISECTNISVGYENEHTGRELQNMTFLIKLCEASVNVDWESLPTVRKVGLNQELIKKHKNLINEIKKSAFGLEVKIIGLNDFIYINIDLDDSDIQSAYDSLISIQTILNKYKQDDEVEISDTYLKIKLK
jgi:hypothetical protein